MAAPRVALVTGAAKRVGAAIARRLHAAGYDLALHHRHSGPEMAALVAELEAARPFSTLVLKAELADAAALPDLVTATEAHFGRLDALVNNASSFYPTPFGTIGEGEWDDLVDSISGSDDDDAVAATQTNLPRKDVSTPTTTQTKTETKTSSDTDKPTTSEYTRKSTYTSYGVRNGGHGVSDPSGRGRREANRRRRSWPSGISP